MRTPIDSNSVETCRSTGGQVQVPVTWSITSMTSTRPRGPAQVDVPELIDR